METEHGKVDTGEMLYADAVKLWIQRIHYTEREAIAHMGLQKRAKIIDLTAKATKDICDIIKY